MKSEKEALVQGGGGWLKLFFMLPRGFSPQLPPLQPSPRKPTTSQTTEAAPAFKNPLQKEEL